MSIARAAPLLPFALLAFACESTPGANADARPPAGDRIDVEVLDARFVRVGGERLPLDEFVYRSRCDGRKWQKEGLGAPPVRLTWTEGVAPRAVVDELITQLRLAGVQQIELGR